jgi:isopentenyl-diphosphate delta-isomerase
MPEHVILVDETDAEIGTAEKMQAHSEGSLHRALSIFVFNSQGALLVQRRARTKYHSGGLWSNTCCSHPRPSELTVDAAHRRLREEMGFDCELRHVLSFIYKADLGAGMYEHEYDHVFSGRYDGDPIPDRTEVDAWRWSDVHAVARSIAARPSDYSQWFRIALEQLLACRHLR